MERLKILDAETFIAAIQDEISYAPEGRYYHRLHVVLQVLKGASCYEAARIYEHSPRSVEYWVKRLKTKGLAGLREGERPGRPPKLLPNQLKEIRKHILLSPRELGYDQNIWDGPLLSYHIEKQFSVHLGIRQCQNLFYKLGFTLQRPRPKAAKANAEAQEDFKKNSQNG